VTRFQFGVGRNLQSLLSEEYCKGDVANGRLCILMVLLRLQLSYRNCGRAVLKEAPCERASKKPTVQELAAEEPLFRTLQRRLTLIENLFFRNLSKQICVRRALPQGLRESCPRKLADFVCRPDTRLRVGSYYILLHTLAFSLLASQLPSAHKSIILQLQNLQPPMLPVRHAYLEN